ncbi:hypothetical protein [Polynucleobacter sp.]|uniref:hypothetical protein n=1 Tax=Polynucleobacter sp. TaxID=2029855 RepID=UPI00333EA882
MSNPKKSAPNKVLLVKRNEVENYLERTLIEDILEASKHIGEHIDSLTRRSTLIQEYLIVIHPEITIRTIRRILAKDIDKS